MIMLSACHPAAVSPSFTGGLAFFGSTLGGGEILVVLLVLLLLFGARRLPELSRAFGRAMEEFRRATHDLSRDLMDEPPSLPRGRGDQSVDAEPPSEKSSDCQG